MNSNNFINSDLNKEIKAAFMSGKFEKALHLAQKALLKAKRKGDQISISHQYKILGNIYSRIGDFIKAHEHYLKALNIFRKLNNLKGISDILGNISTNYQSKAYMLKLQGRCNESNKLINESLEFQQKAVNIRKEILNNYIRQKNEKHIEIAEKNLALSYLNLGGLYRELNLFFDSIKCQKKALRIFRKYKDKYRECKSLLNIGNLFGNIMNFPCSLNFQFQALTIAINKNFKEELPKNFFNIGLTYQYLLDPKNTLTYFLKSLNIFYVMLKEFKDVNLKNRFIETFNILPFIINTIRKMRMGNNKFKDFDDPLKKGAIELYTTGNNISPIRNILINTTEETIVVSDAKELFEFKMENASIIINHIIKINDSEADKVIKNLLFQQIIVIIVNALEIYLKMRFVELNNKKFSLNLEKLYDFFIHANIRTKSINEIKELARNKGLPEIEIFIEKDFISFQKWEDINKAYLLGINIDFNKIIPSKSFQDFLRKFLTLRQQIIHTPFTFPENFKLEFINTAFSLFKEFVEYLHKNSKTPDVDVDLKYLNSILNDRESPKLNSKEIFDENIRKIHGILNYTENLFEIGKEDYRFKIIVYQQLIVMLITAFEIYALNRFLELDKESIKRRKKLALLDLYKNFISKRYRDEYIEFIKEKSKQSGKSVLLLLIEDRRINFKNWDHFKKAFKSVFRIKVGNIYKGDILEKIQHYFKWRNKIIHSKIDSPTLNFENSPPEAPITLDYELIDAGLSYMRDFLNTFHKTTVELFDK